jgi:hypothetical protein
VELFVFDRKKDEFNLLQKLPGTSTGNYETLKIYVAEPEPHQFGGTRAVTQCGSGSKLDVIHRWIIKNATNSTGNSFFTNSNSFLLFVFTFTTI